MLTRFLKKFCFLACLIVLLPTSVTGEERNFESYITQEILPKTDSVTMFTWQGNKYWLKKADPEKQSWLYRKAREIGAYIAPSFLKTTPLFPSQLLSQEAQRLNFCEKCGAACARVIAYTQDWIVTADTGASLETKIKSLPAPEQLELIIKILKMLASNHSKGFIHGRAFLKDMTIDTQGNISLIDIEEDPLKVMPMEDAMARDYFFFLMSALPLLDETSQQKLARAIKEIIPEKPLKKLTGITKYNWVLLPFFWLKNYLGKDGKKFLSLMQYLKGLEKDS